MGNYVEANLSSIVFLFSGRISFHVCIACHSARIDGKLLIKSRRVFRRMHVSVAATEVIVATRAETQYIDADGGG